MSSAPPAYLAAHLRSAEQIIAHYEGAEPFPIYLKGIFRENRKFGGRDRRQVSAFCYAFFRLGHALADLPLRERILAGYFLCTDDPSAIPALKPEWTDAASGNLDQRIDFLARTFPEWSLDDVFPLPEFLSDGIERNAFIKSHFTQPDLFIRLRPGKDSLVKTKLEAAGISFRLAGDMGLAMDNATRLDALGEPDRDFVVQDLSSQQSSAFFPEAGLLPARPLIWDACAGSGGKSIMAADRYPGARLFATDLRPSILHNLEARFRTAGIRNYRAAELDVSVLDTRKLAPADFFPASGFDLVMADVPCSGSGTWSRDPWGLSMVDETDLRAYADRQREIIRHASALVKPGGYFIYITCSVYAMENEEAVDFAGKQNGLRLQEQRLIEGYRNRADTLFAARLRREA